jgi:hypothetical protein
MAVNTATPAKITVTVRMMTVPILPFKIFFIIKNFLQSIPILSCEFLP